MLSGGVESPFLLPPSPFPKGRRRGSAWLVVERLIQGYIRSDLHTFTEKIFGNNMDLPQKNLPQHTVKRGGRTYAIVEALTMQVMDAFIIVCSDEYYADEVSGPYLTYEEALADLESAADRNEMIHARPS